MHGNVWEWCQDTWHVSYKGAPNDGSAWGDNDYDSHLLRGGSWSSLPKYCRSAYRDSDNPDFLSDLIGFRVVCGLARTL